MDNKEALSSLLTLRERIQKTDLAKAEFEASTEALKKAEIRQPRAVNEFDQKTKNAYVISHIGEEPSKPKGIIKLAYPVYRAKKKEFEKKYAEYRIRYDECVAAYYEEYSDQRNKLESEERSEIAYNIQTARQLYNVAKERFETASQELNSDKTLSDKLKRVDVVDELIEIFQDQRADSIKEAVNLFFEEEHRRRLEEYAQEQVRLTSEATEFARQAAESAEEAASRADEAIRQVENAIDRANEAYEKAEEAYSEAQNAYLAAISDG